jgi:serine/threonine protein phosphatase 1
LGDYIDRGPDSKKTLEILCAGIDRKVNAVFLLGNHDQFLIELINFDPSLNRYFINNWYENGGIATMRSLQVEGYGRLLDSNDLEQLHTRTIAALGAILVEFLKNLKPIHKIGKYVFVHAGIDPSADLENQEFADLLLIREPFLSSSASWRHPFCVVHGHSISMPSVHSHRISVDAGCYQNGALCAVQIKEDLLRFIAVTQDPKYPWQEKLGGKAHEWNWRNPIAVCELSHNA